jgi:hypothetical protein
MYIYAGYRMYYGGVLNDSRMAIIGLPGCLNPFSCTECFNGGYFINC